MTTSAKNRERDTCLGRHLPVRYDVISGLWIPVLERGGIAFQGQNCQPVVLSIHARLKVYSLSYGKLNGEIIFGKRRDKTAEIEDSSLIRLEYYNVYWRMKLFLWLTKKPNIISYRATITLIIQFALCSISFISGSSIHIDIVHVNLA